MYNIEFLSKNWDKLNSLQYIKKIKVIFEKIIIILNLKI